MYSVNYKNKHIYIYITRRITLTVIITFKVYSQIKNYSKRIIFFSSIHIIKKIMKNTSECLTETNIIIYLLINLYLEKINKFKNDFVLIFFYYYKLYYCKE